MPDHLNILMVTHHRRFKAQFRSHAMAKHLVQRGHEVSLMIISNRRKVGLVESDWEGVHTIETPDLLWDRLRSGWDVWDLLSRIVYLARRDGRYGLVHCFETRPATIYPAQLYARQHGAPIITDWVDWWGHGGIISKFRPKWYQILFEGIETHYEEAFRARANGLTVISTALAHRAMKLGVSPEDILHIPNGVHLDLFQARRKDDCRNRVGLPLNTPMIGFSSLDSHIDLEIVMEALSIVATRYPSVKLIITGKAGQLVVDAARYYGVEGNLHLTGFLPFEELPWHLGCADLFVLPFPDEAYNVGRWPGKMGQYMSMGRPTVSNPVGDIKLLFENHAIGLLAEWDCRDFAEKIIYLLEHPDVAARLGQNARQVAVTDYDWDLVTDRLEEFYGRVLDQRRVPAAPTGFRPWPALAEAEQS